MTQAALLLKLKRLTHLKALELMLLSVFDESQLRYTDKHREIYFGYIYGYTFKYQTSIII